MIRKVKPNSVDISNKYDPVSFFARAQNKIHKTPQIVNKKYYGGLNHSLTKNIPEYRLPPKLPSFRMSSRGKGLAGLVTMAALGGTYIATTRRR
jgi:hypothetical protein